MLMSFSIEAVVHNACVMLELIPHTSWDPQKVACGEPAWQEATWLREWKKALVSSKALN